MKNPADREYDFRQELAELLAKHGATMEITNDGDYDLSRSGIAIITMYSMWDNNGDKTAEFTEFML